MCVTRRAGADGDGGLSSISWRRRRRGRIALAARPRELAREKTLGADSERGDGMDSRIVDGRAEMRFDGVGRVFKGWKKNEGDMSRKLNSTEQGYCKTALNYDRGKRKYFVYFGEIGIPLGPFKPSHTSCKTARRWPTWRYRAKHCPMHAPVSRDTVTQLVGSNAMQSIHRDVICDHTVQFHEIPPSRPVTRLTQFITPETLFTHLLQRAARLFSPRFP